MFLIVAAAVATAAAGTSASVATESGKTAVFSAHTTSGLALRVFSDDTYTLGPAAAPSSAPWLESGATGAGPPCATPEHAHVHAP